MRKCNIKYKLKKKKNNFKDSVAFFVDDLKEAAMTKEEVDVLIKKSIDKNITNVSVDNNAINDCRATNKNIITMIEVLTLHKVILKNRKDYAIVKDVEDIEIKKIIMFDAIAFEERASKLLEKLENFLISGNFLGKKIYVNDDFDVSKEAVIKAVTWYECLTSNDCLAIKKEVQNNTKAIEAILKRSA